MGRFFDVFVGGGDVDELETQVAVLCTRLDNLQDIVIAERKRLNGNLEKLDKRLEAMDGKLAAAIKEQATKPSWSLSLGITALVGLLSCLITWIVTH